MRICEHQGRSFRTGKALMQPAISSIREHSEICGNDFSESNFKILNASKRTLELRILESMYIDKLQPELNDSHSAAPLYIVK